MRKGISITVTPADRVRLQSIIRDRNSPQKHVWRARIIVLTANGNGTTAITRAVGKGKTVVWRWQERFMHEGVEGLTRDKTRPSRIPPLPAETVDRVIALTNQAPPHEATHWSAPAMARAVGISPSSVRRMWKGRFRSRPSARPDARGGELSSARSGGAGAQRADHGVRRDRDRTRAAVLDRGRA